MNATEKNAVVRSFSSSSVLYPKLTFSSEKSRNYEKSLFNLNLEIPTSCSEKSTIIAKSFKSNSEMISSSPEIRNEFISVNKLEEPLNIIYAGKYHNCLVNYSKMSAKIVQNSNSASISRPSLLEELIILYFLILIQSVRIFLPRPKNILLS